MQLTGVFENADGSLTGVETRNLTVEQASNYWNNIPAVMNLILYMTPLS